MQVHPIYCLSPTVQNILGTPGRKNRPRLSVSGLALAQNAPLHMLRKTEPLYRRPGNGNRTRFSRATPQQKKYPGTARLHIELAREFAVHELACRTATTCHTVAPACAMQTPGLSPSEQSAPDADRIYTPVVYATLEKMTADRAWQDPKMQKRTVLEMSELT